MKPTNASHAMGISLVSTKAKFNNYADAWSVAFEFKDDQRTIWVIGAWQSDTTPIQRFEDAWRIAFGENALGGPNALTGVLEYRRIERRPNDD